MIYITVHHEMKTTTPLRSAWPDVTMFLGKYIEILTSPAQGYALESEEYDDAGGWLTGFTAAKGDKRIAIRASDIQPLFEPTGDLELDTLIADYCDLGDTQPIDVQALKVAM